MEPNVQRNADGRRRIVVRTPCGMSVTLTQRSQWKRNWAHKGRAPERRESAAWPPLQSHRGAFFGYPATTRRSGGFLGRHGRSVVAVLCDGGFTGTKGYMGRNSLS